MKLNDVELPSNRKFGLFFVLVFSSVGTYLYFIEEEVSAFSFFFLSLLTLLIAILRKEWLLPFNKLWMYFGLLLGKIISPVVLGMIFFLLITPIALLMRLSGRDEMRLKLTNRKTHWKQRVPIGPKPSSFNNQF